MPRIYTDANPRMIAYLIEDGDSGYQHLPVEVSAMEAEYMAIIYGLNEFFLRWNRELDARQADMTRESLAEAKRKELAGEVTDPFFGAGSPSDKTKRPLPPPIMILSDNEVVVKQLSRQFHIGNDRLRKLAQNIWNMTKNLEVLYQWTPRKQNKAGYMLK